METLNGSYGGSKTNFMNGFGLTADLSVVDLKTLQIRSLQMMRENHFAATIFGRLTTKVINTGLRLRCNPPDDTLSGFVDGKFLEEFESKTEQLFKVWSKDKNLVSVNGQYTFGELQRTAYRSALCSGDCLVILSINRQGLPTVELIDGINIDCGKIDFSGKIRQGVEFDSKGREVAYWVEQPGLLQSKRVAAKTVRGARRAWLVRATEKRIDDARGLPILSVVLQNINEIGKYMDSEQRAALVNSYIATVHTRGEGNKKQNTLKGMETGSKTVTNSETGEDATFKKAQPGYFVSNLLNGSTLTSFDTKRPNVNAGAFVEICTKQISQSLEIPPEIFMLEYKSNFSASRQAKLDWNDYAQKAIQIFADLFNQPIYEEWLTGMVLNGDIIAPGYIESLKNPSMWKIKGGWETSIWRGLPNKSVDELKQWKAIQLQIELGALTREDAADQYNGTDFYDNARRQKKENEALGLSESGQIIPVATIETLSAQFNEFTNTWETMQNDK